MKNKNQINLFLAVLININVILGAGLFINPKPLTQFAGPFGFTGYILAAIILLPIVLSISKLAQRHQIAGGLYVYSKEYLSPTIGFISAWSYFLGKTSSAALLTHIFVSFFQRKLFFLQPIPVIYLDILFIFFLIFLNIIGTKIGGKIQYLFTFSKLIPFLFVIFLGSYFFNFDLFKDSFSNYPEYFSILPISIFVFLSFEIVCSIGHLIQNPEKNIKRAILISFSIVATATTFFQLAIFGVLGQGLKIMAEPVAQLAIIKFPGFFILPTILNTFVFGSIISGSFGNLTTNCWNLYALAQDKHLPGHNFLTKINSKNVPIICLLIEGIIASILLLITSNQVPLQNMTVLGVATAYFFSSLAALKLLKNGLSQKITPILAILSSCYIVYLCFRNLFLYGLSFPFLGIFLTGILLKIWTEIKQK